MIENITSRFENPQKSGKGWKVRCPCHEDKKNSLGIVEADGGKILLKCQAGCETKTIIGTVGLKWSDLFPSTENAKPREQKDPVVKRYVYVDEQNQPLFRVCRTQAKNFFQERHEKGKWILGLNGMRRVLYRLPDVLKATTVNIVEGEKDADRLALLGLTGTTNPGGAGKWDDSYNHPLRGKDIIVIPDNDQPGQEHALTVACSVLPTAKSLKVVMLPDLPTKGDISDYLTAHTKEDLIRFVENAPLFTGDAGKKGQRGFWPEFLTAKDLLALPPDPTRWVWDQTLPFGGGGVLVSKPKIGKSTFAVNLVIAVSRGLPFLGRNTIQCPVAYLSLDASLPEIAETFIRFGLREADPVFIHAGAAPKDAIEWLAQRIRENGVRLVVVDTLQRPFRFQNVNDYSEVTNTLEPLLEAAREQNAHVMFVHHAKKDAGDDLDSAIGSTAIRGLAYSYLHLKRLPNSERRILRTDQRGGRNFPEVAIGFGTSGWLEVKGTMEAAEIDEAKPKIVEFLEAESGEVTEREIRRAIPMRGIVVSKAVKEMFKANELERSGQGKKGAPFRYSLAATLRVNDDSCPRVGVLGGGDMGHESEKTEKVLAGAAKIHVPESRDTNGTRTDTNPKQGKSGHESEEGWEML